MGEPAGVAAAGAQSDCPTLSADCRMPGSVCRNARPAGPAGRAPRTSLRRIHLGIEKRRRKQLRDPLSLSGGRAKNCVEVASDLSGAKTRSQRTESRHGPAPGNLPSDPFSRLWGTIVTGPAQGGVRSPRASLRTQAGLRCEASCGTVTLTRARSRIASKAWPTRILPFSKTVTNRSRGSAS